MKSKSPGSIRLVASMALGGFVSGMVLVGVYLATLPRIERNRAEALRQAVFKVIPDARSFDTLVLGDGALETFHGGAGAPPPGKTVYLCRDDAGRSIGFAIPFAGPGFQDTIRLLFGFDPRSERIVGMEVLESRETPGLGDKIIFDTGFKSNFTALEIRPEIVAVKPGARTRNNEVDCISGATISSKAVVEILNRGAREWLPHLTNQASLVPRGLAERPPAPNG